jgi:hypothetical protein
MRSSSSSNSSSSLCSSLSRWCCRRQPAAAGWQTYRYKSTKFTCFNSTKVQILTLLLRCSLQANPYGNLKLKQLSHAPTLFSADPNFSTPQTQAGDANSPLRSVLGTGKLALLVRTCFTSTKVQITPQTQAGDADTPLRSILGTGTKILASPVQKYKY